jgi:DNA repair protein RadC
MKNNKDNRKIKSCLHSGHRERLRKKFLQNEKGVLEPHEVLELLLYYSIPRRNTNEISHNLLNAFGNLKGVLEAENSSLENSLYVKKSSIALFKAIYELSRRNAERERMSFSNGYKNCTENIKRLSANAGKGEVYAVYIGIDGKFLFSIKVDIKEKEPFASVLSHKSLVELEIGGVIAFKFIGEKDPFPTSLDLDFANGIKNGLNRLGFVLYEYYLVSNDKIE